MTDYPYDPDLPYVVAHKGVMTGRAATRSIAMNIGTWLGMEVIDTTPKPRVPDDAKWITWMSRGERWLAERVDGGWLADDGGIYEHLVDLPDVTSDTVLTVLDERKS